RIGAAFLTGVHAKPTEGADFRAGISIDQIAAASMGRETQLSSLELGLESTDLAGACDVGFSCAYVNTLCWRSPTTPLPMESIPGAFADYGRLMFDLQVLAYQSDMTRVISFMIGKELSSRTYPEIGVSDPHHPLSHHQNDPARLEKLSRINILHLELFAYYLE